MSEYRIIDDKRYPVDIEGTSKRDVYYEWQHAVTLKKSDDREFMILMNHRKQDFVIIEITEGEFMPIVDRDLIISITFFVSEKNIIEFDTPKLTIGGLSK
jgi:hypothetical protein